MSLAKDRIGRGSWTIAVLCCSKFWPPPRPSPASRGGNDSVSAGTTEKSRFVIELRCCRFLPPPVLPRTQGREQIDAF